MTKVYTGRYAPFQTLKQKITYIKVSGVRFGTMFTKEGNNAMEKVIQKVVNFILNDEKRLNRKEAIKIMVDEWKKIHSKHKEAFETDVKESVLWYVDACLEYRGKKEVSNKELNELHEEKKEEKEKKSVFKLIKPIKKSNV